MKFKVLLLALLLFVLKGVFAQKYLDTTYVQDLNNRIFVSYFQEYRNLNLNITPNKSLDSIGDEKLKLTSATSFYSGIFIQFKSIFINLAGSLPQSAQNEKEFGRQSSNIWRIGLNYNGIAVNFNHFRYTGFYDQNLSQHQFAATEPNAFARYENLRTRWLNFDIKYYPKFNQFAQGMPQNFGLRQIKSKFAWGYKLSYDYLESDNKNKPLFSESLQSQSRAFGLYQIRYNSVNFAVAPSVYGVLSKKIFIYADIWLGGGIGYSNQANLQNSDKKLQFNFSVPEGRFLMGFQNEKWLVAGYFSFKNQDFAPQSFTVNAYHQTFGIIAGYRLYAPVRLAM